MKNKKTNFNPLKIIGALVFLMAFTLNIQTSLNGEWELVNVGFAQGSGGSGGSGPHITCPSYGTNSGACHLFDRKYDINLGWVNYCRWTGYQSNMCILL